MKTKSGYVQVNDGQLFYETVGSGECLVLIHGMGLDTRMWDNQYESFSNCFQVVSYDVRGYGKSTLPTNESYSHQRDLNLLFPILSPYFEILKRKKN